MNKIKHPTKHNQKGFTILELLIATSIFSIVLLIFLYAIITISALFYKGVNMARTQEAARTVISQVTNDLQFTKQSPVFAPTGAPNPNYFCIGTHRYRWALGQQVAYSNTSIQDALIRETVTGCPAPNIAGANKQEMLDPGMQLNNISLKCDSTTSLCIFKIHMVYYGGDPANLFYSPMGYSPPQNAPDATCTLPLTSSQYCVTADYTTSVLQRF